MTTTLDEVSRAIRTYCSESPGYFTGNNCRSVFSDNFRELFRRLGLDGVGSDSEYVAEREGFRHFVLVAFQGIEQPYAIEEKRELMIKELIIRHGIVSLLQYMYFHEPLHNVNRQHDIPQRSIFIYKSLLAEFKNEFTEQGKLIYDMKGLAFHEQIIWPTIKAEMERRARMHIEGKLRVITEGVNTMDISKSHTLSESNEPYSFYEGLSRVAGMSDIMENIHDKLMKHTLAHQIDANKTSFFMNRF